jgi:hypothetical protein
VPALETGAVEAAILNRAVSDPWPKSAGVAVRPCPAGGEAKATPITAIFWNKDMGDQGARAGPQGDGGLLKAAPTSRWDNGWKQERNIDLMVKYTGAKADVHRPRQRRTSRPEPRDGFRRSSSRCSG